MKLALNTSTIRGHALSVPEQINLTKAGGFDGVELWVKDLDRYSEQGGSLAALADQSAANDLPVINLIGFFAWLADDERCRAEGLVEAERNFRIAAQLRCPFVAAPPFGMTEKNGPEPAIAAERFNALLAIARKVSEEEGFVVRPLLEFWGHSQALGTLGEALEVIEYSPEAKLLADVFHMHKKGTDHADIAHIPPQTLEVFHINDYPPCEDPANQPDAARVFPGDGTADWDKIQRGLAGAGFEGWLSLELFNPDYYDRPASEVIREGFEKSRKVLTLQTS